MSSGHVEYLTREQKLALDTRLDIFDLYESLVADLPRGKGISQNVRCPNPHHIDGTPSTRIHQDSNQMWCFTEHKMFRCSDLILWYDRASIKQYLNKLGDVVVEKRDGVPLQTNLNSYQQFTEGKVPWDLYRVQLSRLFYSGD